MSDTSDVINKWLESHTFHYGEFWKLKKLVEAKEKAGLSISLCIPTLNEEETIGKEVSRAASVGFSNTLLSEAGQQAIVEEVEATDETLTAIVDLATEAQDLDVTQDVMKNLSAMAAQQSSLQVAEYGQTIQLRQQFAADAVVQAEAAEDLAALSRRQQTEPMAAAAEVIQSSSTLVLFKGTER